MTTSRIHTYSIERLHATADQVLGILTDGAVHEEVRRDRRRTVSALQVITERIVGGELDSIATGTAHHTTYRYVAGAVRLLETVGFVAVARAAGEPARQGDAVTSVVVLP